MSDFVRLRQTDDAIVMMLKSTHFDTLENVAIRTDVHINLPIIIVKFREAAKDFLVVLNYHDLGESAGWSRKAKLEVILELPDSVIADQVSQKKFTLSKKRTAELMEAFYSQKEKSVQAILDNQRFVYQNKLLLQ